MLNKILFMIVTILSVLAVYLCTSKLAHGGELESWTATGDAIQYCSGIGYQYLLMSKYHDAGVTFHATLPNGEIRPYFDNKHKYTCDVLFMSQQQPEGAVYAIGLHWQFFTLEALEAWEDIVGQSIAHFCEHTKKTHVYGVVKVTYPLGFVNTIDCEEDTEEL